MSVYLTINAANNQADIMALPTRVGKHCLSLAVDTGATVNVISEESYKILKRESRGGKWVLRLGDLNLSGVTGSFFAHFRNNFLTH